MPFTDPLAFHFFSQWVKNTHRYMLNDKHREFLNELLSSARDRERVLAKGTVFWRAQQGSGKKYRDMDGGFQMEEWIPYPNERMKPEEGRQREGRANPKGMPCLYLADTKETAMSEMRAWLDAPITVSKFELVHDVRVVDCTGGYMRVPDWPVTDPETVQRVIWGTVSGAFSDPVNDRNDTADYAATQFVSDAFKQNGYQGVR